jgi:CspA family cold shock protein
MDRETGTVKWFSNEKGYGFIERPDGEDVFVHHSDIRGDGFKTLDPGETVEYERISADKGPKALNVVREGDTLDDTAPPESASPEDGAAVAGDGAASGASDTTGGTDSGSEQTDEDRRSLGAQLREKLGGRFFGGS